MTSSPIVTPGPTIAPAPIQTLRPIEIGFAYSMPSARSSEFHGMRGCAELHRQADLRKRTDRDGAQSRITQLKFRKARSPSVMFQP